MKLKELLEQLKDLDPECEIKAETNMKSDDFQILKINRYTNADGNAKIATIILTRT
jgi:hypothetical protein